MTGETVGKKHVVNDLQRGVQVAPTGGVQAEVVAEEGGDPGFIVRDPVLHTVAKAVGDGVGVLDKGMGRVAIGPPATVLQGLGQIPVVKGGERSYAGF